MDQSSAPEEAPFEGRMSDDFGDFNFDSGRAGDEESGGGGSGRGGAGPSGSADPSSMFDGHDDSFDSNRGSAGRPEQSAAAPPAEADLGGSELGEGDESGDGSSADPARPGRRERTMMRGGSGPAGNQDDTGSAGDDGSNRQPRSFDFDMDGSFDRDSQAAQRSRGRQSNRGDSSEEGERPSRPSSHDSSSQSGRFAIEQEEDHSGRQHSDRSPSNRPHSDRPHSERPHSERPHSSGEEQSSGAEHSDTSGRRPSRTRSGRTPPSRPYQRPSTRSRRTRRPSPSESQSTHQDSSSIGSGLFADQPEDPSSRYSSSASSGPHQGQRSRHDSSSGSPPSPSYSMSSPPSMSTVDDTELRLLQDFERSLGSAQHGASFNTPDGLSPGAAPLSASSFGGFDGATAAARSLSPQPEVSAGLKYDHEPIDELPMGRSMSSGGLMRQSEGSFEGSQSPFVPLTLHGQSLVSPLAPSAADDVAAAVDGSAAAAVGPGKSSPTDP
jgi:hypothetical protein